MILSNRSCGILLHPTSLPGPHGIGTLGAHARAFVDFLNEAGQSLWQILPLAPTGYGDSPYSALSVFAGNPLLIDLDTLAEDGLIEQAELTSAPPHNPRVDYNGVYAHKLPLLQKAAERFHKKAPLERRRQFEKFCQDNEWWLLDYALFMGLKKAQDGRCINQWPEDIRRRQPGVMERTRNELQDDVYVTYFTQFCFFEQWNALREYAHQKGIQIMGDIPIFVAYDSVAVWAEPGLFKIDDNLIPSVVAGVPPDYFSKDGQLWGNPLYDWKYHEQTGFKWWLDRMAMTLAMTDIVRLDHFRGFQAAWEVAASETTARNGTWIDGPGDAFFAALGDRFKGLPIVAEDLGLITPEVHALRDRFGIPGMHVLQFGFTAGDDRVNAPHRTEKNSVVYTGTHDNNTTVGWFAELSERERNLVKAYLDTSGASIHTAMMRAAYATSANTVIVPIQDILGLGSEARMNTPGIAGSSWAYRMTEMPSPTVSQFLHELAWLFERLPEEKQIAERKLH